MAEWKGTELEEDRKRWLENITQKWLGNRRSYNTHLVIDRQYWKTCVTRHRHDKKKKKKKIV